MSSKTGRDAEKRLGVTVLLQRAHSHLIPSHDTDSVLTHRHFDHTAGLPSVLELLHKLRTEQQQAPRIHKFVHPGDTEVEEYISEAPSGSYTPVSPSSSSSSGATSTILHRLQDNVVIPLSDPALASAISLRTIHAPGHDQDHCCFFLQDEGRLFTGDHVLGQGTSVFNDLGAYMRSLKKCSDLLEREGRATTDQGGSGDNFGGDASGTDEGEVLLYPAHGPTIAKGRTMLKQYYAHRLERENQVLDLLAKPPASSSSSAKDVAGEKAWTIEQIVAQLYAKYPKHLWPAAARGIFRHLHKLALPDPDVASSSEGDGQRVRCLDTKDGRTPPEPTHEEQEKWEGLMQLRWTLLQAQQQTRL